MDAIISYVGLLSLFFLGCEKVYNNNNNVFLTKLSGSLSIIYL